jgi:hypothetical protein
MAKEKEIDIPSIEELCEMEVDLPSIYDGIRAKKSAD